jgi:hypothetical protein
MKISREIIYFTQKKNGMKELGTKFIHYCKQQIHILDFQKKFSSHNSVFIQMSVKDACEVLQYLTVTLFA